MVGFSSDYVAALDRCKDFGDIFVLVKRAVKELLGYERGGLMLYMADLPLHIGAFHGVGSNAIVMNRRLLNMVVRTTKSIRQINSFVFSILMHEYLHSLGYLDEGRVRRLVYEVTRRILGEEHEATAIAISGPVRALSVSEMPNDYVEKAGSPELVSDFDRSNQTYIS